MIACLFQKYTENLNTLEIRNFLKMFLQFLFSFLFISKTLQLNNLESRAAMNAKISVFCICVKAIIYLLLCNLHDCTFKSKAICQ